MCTHYVWVVWKAMMMGCDFFTRPKRCNGQVSIYDNFELSDELLDKVRCEFVARVKEQNKQFAKFSIIWTKPEAAIVDSKGQAIEISPRTEIVDNDCHCSVCKRLVKTIINYIKRHCLFFL